MINNIDQFVNDVADGRVYMPRPNNYPNQNNLQFQFYDLTAKDKYFGQNYDNWTISQYDK